MRNGWHQQGIPNNNVVGIALLESHTTAWLKHDLKVLFTAMENHERDGYWKHASISHSLRYPTWDEILDVRYSFFDDTDEVFQVLPPKKEYINLHKNCFHLWCKVGVRLTPG